MYEPDDDDKESLNDKILEMLGGEVDDYAGSQLPDEEKPAAPAKGVEISITVTPHAGEKPEPEGDEDDDEDEGKHDDIEHALGMHDGGCVY